MTTVIFYEKPGCKGNARQRTLLEAAGHAVEARNLLAEVWTGARLLSFFQDLPVAAWFNPTAPKVTRGEIHPEALDAGAALALLVAEPLLIRRPLMESEGRRLAGWDPDRVNAWIGLNPDLDAHVTCQHHGPDHGHEEGTCRSK